MSRRCTSPQALDAWSVLNDWALANGIEQDSKAGDALNVVASFICNPDRSEPVYEPARRTGLSANYYKFSEPVTELQDLISQLNCNAQLGEILRAVVRYGKCSHSPKLRDIEKIEYYAKAEKARLLKYENDSTSTRIAITA